MIKFIDTAFVGGVVYRSGQVGIFDAPTEAQLISVGDAINFPVINQPVETLSSSAISVACASTAIDEVLASYTIPAGTLGVNSILQIEPLWAFASSINNKICKVKIGATTIYTSTRTTSVKEAPLVVLANRNSLAAQIQPYDYQYVQAASGAPATYTLDFSVWQTITITGQRAAAEALSLEYYRILHFSGA